jgi:hypothetical protein
MEAVAPVYTSMMPVPTKLEQPVTTPPLLVGLVNWFVSLAPTFGFDPLLPR